MQAYLNDPAVKAKYTSLMWECEGVEPVVAMGVMI
jgi:hypothetical protein